MSSTYRSSLGDRYDLGTGFVPADMQTAQTGKRLFMGGLYSVDVVLIKAAGTAGDDPVLTLQSHTAASGGTTASLSRISEYHIKKEATLDNDETWTTVTQTEAATISDPGGATTSAEEQQIVVFTIANEDLPAGHQYISVNVADTGSNAQLGTVLYIMHPMNKVDVPASLPAPLR